MVTLTKIYQYFDAESNKELECETNSLNAHNIQVIRLLVTDNENLSDLAPGEDRETRQILCDENVKNLNFIKCFCKENLDLLFHVNTILTPTK